MSVKKNTIYNLLGAALSLGLTFFLTPIYLRLIGEARYGVLAVAWLLLGYFGLFDLGLGRATAQRIASIVGSASSTQRALIFWTAFGMNCSLGALGGLIIWPLATYFFGNFFNVDIALQPELFAAIPWLILAVPLATLSGVLTGALQGRAQFLELNIIAVFGSALAQLLPFIFVWMHGPDLGWILFAVILSRLVTLALLFSRCSVHVFHGQAPIFSRTLARDLLRFGGWVTVTSLVGPMMVLFDRFVIGATLGAKAVTHYTVPFQLAESSTLLPSALTTAIFPRLVAADASEARQLAKIAIRSLAVLMTPLTLLGVLLVEPFLRWWLSSEFALNAGLSAQILLLGFWFNAFAGIPYALLQAAGRPDIVARCHLGELFPYLLLLYIGLHFWGLPGAAVVFGLRTFVDCALLMWFAGIFQSGAKALKTPIALLLTGLATTIGLPVDKTAGLLAAFGLLSFALVWSWRTAPHEVRDLFTRMINRSSSDGRDGLQ